MTSPLRFALLLIALCLTFGCGPTTGQPQPCQATCDCTGDGPDITPDCVGEWTCNANKVCEYTCAKNMCSGQVYTCPDETDCNGSFCSARKFAGCSP